MKKSIGAGAKRLAKTFFCSNYYVDGQLENGRACDVILHVRFRVRIGIDIYRGPYATEKTLYYTDHP